MTVAKANLKLKQISKEKIKEENKFNSDTYLIKK